MNNIKITKINWPINKSSQQVYAFILRFYEDNKYMPALSEIGEYFGKTKMWAKMVLADLHKQKKIRVFPGKHRGISLIIKNNGNKKS